MKKIQNNRINFNISARASERQYSLKSGEFQIKDYNITSGQPSDVQIGDTLHCDQSGVFNFRIGRKGSKEVANWFNSICNPYVNTTFAHSAGKLNFALMGTLRLKISIISVNQEFDVEFDEILLAQGKIGSSNNWWFGGKNCQHILKDQVVSNGSTEDKNNFRFRFSRGSNDIHTVDIVKVEFFTWMNTIDDSKFLHQINIPGTHDSGTYNFKRLIFRDYVTTQNLSIRGQLEFGIRFLDIRCRHINNAFAIHHAGFYCNLVFGEVLEQCISFLRENESECIIMLIKEEHNPKGNTREFYQTFLNYVNENDGSEYWYDKKTIPRLKEVRKKIVLLYRFDFKEHSFGINVQKWGDNQTFKIENVTASLWIQDEYSVSKKNKSKAIKQLVDESNKRENYWYLNFISLAPSFLVSVGNTSNFTNGIIDDIAKNIKIGFLGLIIMDFPNLKQGLTSTIIDNNRFFAYHLYPSNSLYEVEKTKTDFVKSDHFQ